MHPDKPIFDPLSAIRILKVVRTVLLQELEPEGIFQGDLFLVIDNESLIPSFVYDFRSWRWEYKDTGKYGIDLFSLIVVKRHISEEEATKYLAELFKAAYSDPTYSLM